MKNKVVIIGGGVAGLTAAHELAERRFEVTLFERRTHFGGKAASQPSEHGFPGEHGFRFFPGWYRHLPDTLSRIPYRNGTYVSDNLVPARENVFASYGRPPIRALLRLPRSLSELKTFGSFPERLAQIGLTMEDFTFFLGKLNRFAALSDEQRRKEYADKTWWELMEADKRSKLFRDYLVDGVTRNTIAAKADEASAYTVALVALRTLLDVASPLSEVDRVLNAPSNEAWIDPWVNLLKAKGVNLVTDAELDTVELDGPRITGLRVVRGIFARRESEAAFLAATAMKRLHSAVWKDAWKQPGPALPPDLALERKKPLARIANRWAALALADEVKFEAQVLSCVNRIEAVGPVVNDDLLGALAKLLKDADDVVSAGWDIISALHKEIEDKHIEALRSLERLSSELIKADYYIFALPVEQMAYYVHRSEMLRQQDPSLRNIIRLSDHVGWMAGIQFYLTEKEEFTRGHIDCLDSEWHLTALFQGQFWSDIDLRDRGSPEYRGMVRTVLSVDISAWDKKGRLHRREAFSCTPEEIAQEVWHQLKESLNRPGQSPVLRDEDLLGWKRNNKLEPEAYNLDASIIDRFDRKKQAFYQKFESVRFSGETLRSRKRREAPDEQGVAFAYGKRTELNAEPLLINRAGALHLQPTHTTAISNMYLAADYVRTQTHLATMEAANEAARLAVNEILKDAGDDRLCKLYGFNEPFELAKSVAGAFLSSSGLEALNRPVEAVAQAAAAAASVATKVASGALARFFDRRR